MKKRGFTLIELLAVIVVLAIIALIATPIVMNTIKRSQKGAAERSADNYIEAVETAVATSRLDSDGVQDGTYTIGSDGNLTGTGLPNGKLTIEMSGNKPSGGTIAIKDGQVTTDSKMTIGSYEVAYNSTNKKYEATEKDGSSSTNVLCKAVTTATTGNIPSGSFNYGDEYICNLGDTDDSKNLTFFVLDKTDTEVSLIMNKNLGNTTIWAEEVTDTTPVIANMELQSRIENWNVVANKIKVGFPSKNQIEKTYTGSMPIWLYDYLDGGTPNTVSNLWGYWTSSPNTSGTAWVVVYQGTLDTTSIGNDVVYGIRPVITVSKSQLN